MFWAWGSYFKSGSQTSMQLMHSCKLPDHVLLELAASLCCQLTCPAVVFLGRRCLLAKDTGHE